MADAKHYTAALWVVETGKSYHGPWTAHTTFTSAYRAILWYDAIAVSDGEKKRLTRNGEVIRREFSHGPVVNVR